MKNFLKTLADYVFSFYTICFGLVVLFGWLIVNLDHKSMAAAEQKRIATEACYAQGMVLVQSDAGERCAAPQSLVKVK